MGSPLVTLGRYEEAASAFDRATQASIPDRTRLQLELLFPLRAGRSKQQIGKKGLDKGRWSVGY